MVYNPTLAEVNADIRNVKELIKKEEHLIKFMKTEISKKIIKNEIENKKEILKCLNEIKEKLS